MLSCTRRGGNEKVLFFFAVFLEFFFQSYSLKLFNSALVNAHEIKEKGLMLEKRFLFLLKKISTKKKYLSATERENFSFYYFSTHKRKSSGYSFGKEENEKFFITKN